MLNINKINKLNKNTWFFRFKKFWKDYLITNDIAKYSFLTKGEFGDFISWKIISWDKYYELLQKWFIKNKVNSEGKEEKLGDEDYEKGMSLAYAEKNKFLAYGPSLHIIVTTLRCNHKCQYCHAAAAPMTAKNMDMTEKTAKKVVDTIFYTSNTNLTIEFQGWESLVNWDVIKYIVEYAEIKAIHLQKKITFALVTNLTLMDDEKLNYLIEHNVHISTSLDWDEEIHNYNRTFKDWNSFEKVTYWINKINSVYKEKDIRDRWWDYLKVWALLTVTKKALPKYKEIIDTYVGLWLNGVFLRPLNPYWFASSDLIKLSYSTEDFIVFYNKSMDYILELNKKWINFNEMLSSIYLTKILTTGDPNYLDERSPCWAWIGQVAYNYDGKIYTCDEGRMLWRMWDDSFLMTETTDNSEETYNNMIESETTKIMVQASTLDWLPGYNDSVYKPYIWVCPINSYKLSWNIIPNFAKDTKTKLGYAVLDYIFDKLRSDTDKKIFEKWLGLNNDVLTSQWNWV